MNLQNNQNNQNAQKNELAKRNQNVRQTNQRQHQFVKQNDENRMMQQRFDMEMANELGCRYNENVEDNWLDLMSEEEAMKRPNLPIKKNK